MECQGFCRSASGSIKEKGFNIPAYPCVSTTLRISRNCKCRTVLKRVDGSVPRPTSWQSHPSGMSWDAQTQVAAAAATAAALSQREAGE